MKEHVAEHDADAARGRPGGLAGVRPAAVSGPAERRARLLTALLVALLVLAGTAFLVVLVVDPSGTPRRGEYGVLIGAVLVMLGLALALNRAGRYPPAAFLAVACALLAPWASALMDSTILKSDFVPLTYVVVPVLLCGILLSARVTAAVAAAQVVALVVCAVVLAPDNPVNWPSLCIMVLMVSALSIVANVMIQADMDQILRQNHQLEEGEAALREQSVRDHVTGLFNRRYLEETLERELRRADRDGSGVGVIMLDLDRFKQLNDTCGHAAGDLVLREIGTLLRANLRYDDIACRYGGDELTLILPRAPHDVVLERAQFLRLAVADLRLTSSGEQLPRVTLSAGVAMFPDDGDGAEDLLAAGDGALYRAKRAGRDRVCDAVENRAVGRGRYARHMLAADEAAALSPEPGVTPR
jgi:diguanylate cyclase (GGDEF)-like protein